MYLTSFDIGPAFDLSTKDKYFGTCSLFTMVFVTRVVVANEFEQSAMGEAQTGNI